MIAMWHGDAGSICCVQLERFKGFCLNGGPNFGGCHINVVLLAAQDALPLATAMLNYGDLRPVFKPTNWDK
jgi:hypothetical protein